MGLDMYLNRMPRYKRTTAKAVSIIESYLDWLRAKEEGSGYANCTFARWSGTKNIPTQDKIDFYKQFYTKKYSSWDTKHEYGHYRIMEQVGYWRKANHIHTWFVDNIQDGEDDCAYHREVTKTDLEELLDVCQKVLDNPDVAKDNLPTQGGFFFGSTDYDEYYLEDIRDTIDIITKVLETTDFEKEMIYYVSSW